MARANWFLVIILILSLIVLLLPPDAIGTRLKQESGESGRPGRCLESGAKCEGKQDECCTGSCRAVKNRKNKVCCVPEGSLCSPSNADRSLCCGAATCALVDVTGGKNQVFQDRKIFMCQVIVQPIKYDMRIPQKKKS